ncbi:MAG TPA: hypothetical protein VN577_14615 [Terriglobales bacterium]|nr:hypothetical protein [Terriglobales bacterium]
MGEFLLALAVIGAVLLWAGCKALHGFVSGEPRQMEEQEQSLWEAKSKFREAVLRDRFPSEAVLSVLLKCHSYTDDDGYHNHRIPDDLGHIVPYLRYGIDFDEAVNLVREQQRAEAERESTTNEYKETVERFANVISLCSAPWNELNRTAKALHGDFSSVPFLQVLKYDLLQILKSMSVANGTVPEGLGRLYQAVFAQLEPKTRLTVADCVTAIAQWEHDPVKLPAAIDQLRTFDQMKADCLHQTVAATYCSFVQAAYKCFSASTVVRTVMNEYDSLLTPFIPRPEQAEASNRLVMVSLPSQA